MTSTEKQDNAHWRCTIQKEPPLKRWVDINDKIRLNAPLTQESVKYQNKQQQQKMLLFSPQV